MDGLLVVAFGIVLFLLVVWLLLRWCLSGTTCRCTRDLRGKHAVLTGVTSGMGVPIARRLAAAGADLVLVVRDVAAGERLAATLHRDHPACGATAVVHADLADLASVRAALPAIVRALAGFGGAGDPAGGAGESAPPLHVLVNNAGVLLPPLPATAQGLETHFGVNYVAAVVLTRGLLPCLRAAGGDARVVVLTSVTHALVPRVLGGVREALFAAPPRAPTAAGALLRYAHSKHALLLFARALARREERVRVCAVDPGIVCTGITRHMPPVVDSLWQHLFVFPSFLSLFFPPVSLSLFSLTHAVLGGAGNRHVGRSAETGAQTAVHCVLAPAAAVPSGALFRDCHAVPCTGAALAPAAQDRLWAQTERLLAALSPPECQGAR